MYHNHYQGYPVSKNMPSAKQKNVANTSKQGKSKQQINMAQAYPKQYYSSGCGCGSKLPKR